MWIRGRKDRRFGLGVSAKMMKVFAFQVTAGPATRLDGGCSLEGRTERYSRSGSTRPFGGPRFGLGVVVEVMENVALQAAAKHEPVSRWEC